MSVTMIEGRDDRRAKVLIAGGGVAGVEALLAFAAISPARVSVELMAPEADFVYRPMSVAEPFGRAAVNRLPLAAIAAEHDARYRQDALTEVDADRHVAITSGGTELHYDFLLMAMGARATVALPGALTFRGPEDVDAFEELLGGLQRGAVKQVAFAVPHAVRWPVPIYELALMTAAHLAAREVTGVKIAVVTHEREPLDVFGPGASERVRSLAAAAGVELVTSSAPASVQAGRLMLMSGAAVPADRVVALPKLDVPEISGIPQGPHGFIPTDLFLRVEGLETVYAAGDATWYPVKQGGLAAQQADVAARAIAAAAGESLRPVPFHPVLRGILLGGRKPLHMRSDSGTVSSDQTVEPLWWPPGKIAGRYLAPYLATQPGDVPRAPLADIERPSAAGPGTGHGDALEMALVAADASARAEDFEGALRWLAAAEQLNVVLPIEYARRRRAWRGALAELRQIG
jgi:sulfide:quinone oxidoreductase